MFLCLIVVDLVYILHSILNHIVVQIVLNNIVAPDLSDLGEESLGLGILSDLLESLAEIEV